MSKKIKNKSKAKEKSKAEKKRKQQQPKARGKKRAVLESGLVKLRELIDKIVARQKAAKRRGKLLEQAHKALAKRVGGVEVMFGKQAKGLRELAAKNNALKERLKKQAEIVKATAARLEKYRPVLKTQRALSERTEQRVDRLRRSTQKIKKRYKTLEQGLASLAQKTDRLLDSPQRSETDKETDAQLEQLQARLVMLEDGFDELEAVNRQLSASVDDLADRDAGYQEQNQHFREQRQQLESESRDQQTRLAQFDTRLSELQTGLSGLEQGLQQAKSQAEQGAAAAQHLQELGPDLSSASTSAREPAQQLSEAFGRQLQSADDRLQALQQQVDHLSGLLVTTEGQLAEKSTQLSLEGARLLEQTQRIERRIGGLEGSTEERAAHQLQPLKALLDSVQERQQASDSQIQVLRRQVDDLDALVATSGGQLVEQTARLSNEDAALQQQMQLIRQQLDGLQQELGDTRAQELKPLQDRTDTLARQLEEVHQKTGSVIGQIEALADSSGRLSEKTAGLAADDARLSEQTELLRQGLEGLQQEFGVKQAAQLGALKSDTEDLQQRLQMADTRDKDLNQKVDDLNGLLQSAQEQLAGQQTALAKQNGQLASAQQLTEARQKKSVWATAAAMLLLLLSGIAGYWLLNRDLVEQRTVATVQLEAFSRQLQARENALVGQPEPTETASRVTAIDKRLERFESRLVDQEKLFNKLEKHRGTEHSSTQVALEQLDLAVAQQKQAVVDQRAASQAYQAAMQRIASSQQQRDRLLQQLTAELSHQQTINDQLQAEFTALREIVEKAGPQRAEEAPLLPGAQGAAWLKQLDPASYVIQLAAAHDRSIVDRAAGAVRQNGELAIYTRRFQGRDWHVLIQGEFPDRKQAILAIEQLPPQIKAFEPWVRRVSSVRRELSNPGR